MRILHVVPTYLPATRYGGPIYSVHGLCSALVKKNVDVCVYTTSVDGDTNSDVEHGKSYFRDGVEIKYFESKYLRRIYYSPTLKNAIANEIGNFDLVHLHSIFLYPTNIAARIAFSKQIPCVLSPRGMLEKSLISNKSRWVKRAWLRCFEQQTIEKSKLLHLTSGRERIELEKFDYQFPETVVIPNGVDRVELKPTDTVELHNQVFKLLFIGRLNWKKQIDHIIRALDYIDFEIQLTIAGNDEEDYQRGLSQLIIDLGLNQRDNIKISFPGQVIGHAKRNLYQNSDVMILPSKSENFGNTVIEAMAHGCPVIVTPQVGASEVVEQAQAGLITNGSPESIAECINQLHDQQQMSKQMSDNAIKAIKQQYLWPTIADQMIQAYQGVIK